MAVILGGNDTLPQIALTESQTFVPPQDGTVMIHVIGAGGGGMGSGEQSRPNGAGAGGYCRKNALAVTTAGSFTVVIGAGATGSINEGDGGNGGNSTVAGTGLSATLTANGGTGATTSDNTGAGGGASNGDVNNTGGAGGTFGGGAVGVYGTGNAGSSATNGASQGGGDSDALGVPSMSGFGHIVGGYGGKMIEVNTNAVTGNRPSNNNDGDFLAGGGSFFAIDSTGIRSVVYGGRGGNGGGGGGVANKSEAGDSRGGDGGDGLVLIQYLPS